MAFASVGSLGTVNSTNADQSSLVLTTSAALEAGNLGVICIAVDNNQTTDGDEGAVSGVVDSAGNTWTKAGEFTNGQGSAQAGATCSVWYCRATGTLASGGTITASFTNSTSRDASAATAWEFTCGAVSVEATGTLATDGARDPGSLDAATANIACLRFRGAASETGPITFTPTASPAFTALTSASAQSGGNLMTAAAEFVISTATGAASAPVYNGASRNHASVYVALKEVAAASSQGLMMMFR